MKNKIELPTDYMNFKNIGVVKSDGSIEKLVPKLISIHDFKTKGLNLYYGSSKRVYRQFHVEKLLIMWRDLHYLCELHTRCQLVPCNPEFLTQKAIPAYNSTMKRLQEKYPNIIEFQNYRGIAS